jgi:predicted enzyme related to lactoylglutathione lyase
MTLEPAMANDVAHFAIHADDCERAKSFYENVFGWSFEPWGPPGFWLVTTSPRGIRGALQQRREPVNGKGMIGYECTVSVDDLDAIAAAIPQHGGTISRPPMVIETVGRLLMFEDTEGNTVGAMRYEPGMGPPD